jgi:hypothetical protein
MNARRLQRNCAAPTLNDRSVLNWSKSVAAALGGKRTLACEENSFFPRLSLW